MLVLSRRAASGVDALMAAQSALGARGRLKLCKTSSEHIRLQTEDKPSRDAAVTFELVRAELQEAEEARLSFLEFLLRFMSPEFYYL